MLENDFAVAFVVLIEHNAEPRPVAALLHEGAPDLRVPCIEPEATGAAGLRLPRLVPLDNNSQNP